MGAFLKVKVKNWSQDLGVHTEILVCMCQQVSEGRENQEGGVHTSLKKCTCQS